MPGMPMAHEEEENPYGEESKFEGNSDTELSQQIDKLIEEAKKRKVSESNDLHFLKFLNKSQVDSYYSLTNEEQEQVKLYINEKSYFTSSDVLKMIGEALSVKNESLEERLIRLMPENIKPIWSQLNESSKKSILSQARLYPDLTTESKVEHFWLTRPFKKNESVTKKLVEHNALIQEDKLSDGDVTAIMERFKNL
jgi:DNA-binding transcriptional regulator YhcF (GntR family)